MSSSVFDSTELPALQPRTHCVLIPRDPDFIYAYWDYTEEDINRLRREHQCEEGDLKLILRVYDVTFIKFNGSNANHTWDLEIGPSIQNRHIHVWQDNSDYCVELGLQDAENNFIPLTRSNMVRTPPKSVSKRDDLIWQDIKAHKEYKPYIKQQPSKKKSHAPQEAGVLHLSVENIRSYYSRVSKAGGHAPSLEDILQERLKGLFWQKVRPFILKPDLIKTAHPGASGRLVEKGVLGHELDFLAGASENLVDSKAAVSEQLAGPQGGGSEARLKKRKFFFEVWTELIVHGRTEPDAAVWLNQKGIKLNPDGTFSLRYALIDGEIPLKFIAQSSDGIEQRHIQTRVERAKTIYFPKMLKEFHG